MLHLRDVFQPCPVLLPGEAGFDAYTQDVVLTLRPEAVLRPGSKSELIHAIKTCIQRRIPYTASAARTSVTGASVTNTGVLIALEKLNRIVAGPLPHPLGHSLQVEPGVMLSEVQALADSHRLQYPPDPTSWEEIQIGGSVATNATGEDSYRYGSTRNYVLGLEYIDHEGNPKTLHRTVNPLNLPRSKNMAGLNLDLEAIDLFIGSEGTLGVISELELLLIPAKRTVIAIMLFLPDESLSLSLTQNLHAHREELQLICLEYMDQTASAFMQARSTRFKVPENACTLYVKMECLPDESLSDFEERVLTSLESLYSDIVPKSQSLFDKSILASDRQELREFRRLRHHVPATINEIAAINRKEGGGKIGSDWWVPVEHLQEQFQFLRTHLKALSLPCAIFGHIGNGHPHVNIMPKNAMEKSQALEYTKLCMQNAARLGGGVCGEHGLGKIKTWALALQWDEQVRHQMHSTKLLYDPAELCAPGNIFATKE